MFLAGCHTSKHGLYGILVLPNVDNGRAIESADWRDELRSIGGMPSLGVDGGNTPNQTSIWLREEPL